MATRLAALRNLARRVGERLTAFLVARDLRAAGAATHISSACTAPCQIVPQDQRVDPVAIIATAAAGLGPARRGIESNRGGVVGGDLEEGRLGALRASGGEEAGDEGAALTSPARGGVHGEGEKFGLGPDHPSEEEGGAVRQEQRALRSGQIAELGRAPWPGARETLGVQPSEVFRGHAKITICEGNGETR